MISDGLLIVSWILMVFGIYGVFKMKGIYNRLLSSAKIDSVTVIALFGALIIRSGWSGMSLKLFVVLVFYLLTNPLSNQIVASSALRGGIKPKWERKKENEEKKS